MQLELTLVYNFFPAAEIEFNLVEDRLPHTEHRLDQVSSIGQVRGIWLTGDINEV